ncbi:ROK family protein [Sporosarcina sp. ANT_H38]|uniref:ROK family protein n=1 Tax=Sporosarcina sp. ANT_H38 TaxID=2597358 RepID=UPI00165DDFA0|nr:ROK family protein [Sporosarcina sp. ANT_H38]
MELQRYLLFDIGGTHVKWGILNQEGKILSKNHFEVLDVHDDSVLQGMRNIIISHKNVVKGIGISAPGFIDSATGYIEKGGAIKFFDDFHLKSILEDEFNVSVTIENDVNCVALAEQWLGNGKGLKDFICITIGTSIGGSLIINGELYGGHSFRAGEFGYIITEDMNHRTPLEGRMGRTSSMSILRKKYANHYSMPLCEVSGERIFQDFDAKDPFASELVDTFYQNLAIGIYNITSIFNPEKVLIGGGITARELFLDELTSKIDSLNEFFDIKIDLCYFKNDSGLVGALVHHLNQKTVRHG